MRHRCRVAKLSRAADQRRAMLRSLTTSLLLHGEIMTTLPRARELSRQASRMITLAKQGDVAAVRRAARYVFPVKTAFTFESKNGKPMPVTVLRHLFHTIGPRFAQRQGGYVRVLAAPPRRGDNAKMALVQLVD